MQDNNNPGLTINVHLWANTVLSWREQPGCCTVQLGDDVTLFFSEVETIDRLVEQLQAARKRLQRPSSGWSSRRTAELAGTKFGPDGRAHVR